MPHQSMNAIVARYSSVDMLSIQLSDVVSRLNEKEVEGMAEAGLL